MSTGHPGLILYIGNRLRYLLAQGVGEQIRVLEINARIDRERKRVDWPDTSIELEFDLNKQAVKRAEQALLDGSERETLGTFDYERNGRKTSPFEIVLVPAHQRIYHGKEDYGYSIMDGEGRALLDKTIAELIGDLLAGDDKLGLLAEVDHVVCCYDYVTTILQLSQADSAQVEAWRVMLKQTEFPVEVSGCYFPFPDGSERELLVRFCRNGATYSNRKHYNAPYATMTAAGTIVGDCRLDELDAVVHA